MKVGLINIEPKIFNTAYMQISQYHKDRDDTVEWVNLKEPLSLMACDKVYCSSLFTFTDKSQIPGFVIKGGTGFDIKSELPGKIEDAEYDYTIYPACDISFLWLSRGCIRNCGFCVVHDKEGEIHPVMQKDLNPNGEYIKVMDNNFFANPKWREAISYLQELGQPVDFQGIDVRILTDEMCDALNTLKHKKQIHIAWDNPKGDLTDKIKQMLKKIKAYRIMCYVLVGYNSTEKEDLMRLRTLHGLKIHPYVMPIDRKSSYYQRKIQKWNNGFAYQEVKWEDFEF